MPSPSLPPLAPLLRSRRVLTALACAGGVAVVALLGPQAAAGAEGAGFPGWPWWMLPLSIFGLTTAMGVLAVLAGVGGGVMFVPLMSWLMPFVHIDFVRGAGIMVALAGALSAGPSLIRRQFTDLRLAIPLALSASLFSIFGAQVGLALAEATVQLLLGVIILGTAGLLAAFRPLIDPDVGRVDRVVQALGIEGHYYDEELERQQHWRPRSLIIGVVAFAVIGFMAGMFGLGAGWANTPVLNLLMGLPLKFSVATSYFLLAIAGPSAALVYLTRGAMLPVVVVPAVLGSMLGARLGAVVLMRLRPGVIRLIIIAVLALAGLRALLKGLGI